MWFSVIQEGNAERFKYISNGDEREEINMRVMKVEARRARARFDVKSKGKGQFVITFEFMMRGDLI